ncbi:enolase N-terminal-like fold-containing protein, partial [Methanotorris formicicus]
MIEDIVKRVIDFIDGKDIKIVDFSFALPYSYVLVEVGGKKSLGVAMTLLEEYKGHSEKRKIEFDVGNIEDFINVANDFDIINRTLGLATINAISQSFIKLTNEDLNKDVANLILENGSSHQIDK